MVTKSFSSASWGLSPFCTLRGKLEGVEKASCTPGACEPVMVNVFSESRPRATRGRLFILFSLFFKTISDIELDFS